MFARFPVELSSEIEANAKLDLALWESCGKAPRLAG
jgi:hypothetical protein